MPILEAILWGVMQGVTEFIPISSSGHLVIIPRLFGAEAPSLAFNIYLHFGTLLAVIIFFWKDIITLFTSQKKLGGLVLLGTLPIFISGLLFAGAIEKVFLYSQVVGWMLIINGCILLAAHLRLLKYRGLASILNPGRAVAVGIAQAIALLPGISRGGITITTGIYAGLDRKDAYKFSFLLFVPATLLAFSYSLKELTFIKGGFDITMLIGTLSSAVFGILALKILYVLLVKARLYFLAIYCIVAGFFTLLIG